jgi:uncharacterized protein (TIRG00374 family)
MFLRKCADFALRAGISLGLLVWIFSSHVNWDGMAAVFGLASLPLLGVALLMRVLGLVISASRWRGMLIAQGDNVPLSRLADSYVISSYFNLILPTRFGGDIFRTLDQRGGSRTIARSASIIFVERLFGLYALVGFAILASLVRLPLLADFPMIGVALIFSVGIVALLGIALNVPVAPGTLKRLLPSWKMGEKLVDAWNSFRTTALILHQDRRSLARGLAFSILLQLNVIIHYWIIGVALGFEVPLIDYFYLIPIQHIILLAPTINGLGVREASNIFLFASHGIDATAAVAFSLVDLGMMMIFGFFGWLRYVSRPTALSSATA